MATATWNDDPIVGTVNTKAPPIADSWNNDPIVGSAHPAPSKGWNNDPIVGHEDTGIDPEHLYASVKPEDIDVDPRHFGGVEKAANDPIWKANVAEQNRRLAVQQEAIDAFKAKQNTPSESALAKTGAFLKATPGAIGGAVKGVAGLFAAPIEAIADEGPILAEKAGILNPDNPVYQSAKLRNAAVGAAVQNELYDPISGRVMNAPRQVLSGALETVRGWVNGQPKTDEAIRQYFEHLAPGIRASQNIDTTTKDALAQDLGQAPQVSVSSTGQESGHAEMTPEAEKMFQETKGQAETAVTPINLALLGGGAVAGKLVKGVVSPIAADVVANLDHPLLAPAVNGVKQIAQAAATGSQGAVRGLGKAINTSGNVIGSKGADMLGGALVAHSFGENPWIGALAGRLLNPIIKPIGSKISQAGQALAEKAGPAAGDQMRLNFEKGLTDAAGNPIPSTAEAAGEISEKPLGTFGKVISNPLTQGAVGGMVFSIPQVLSADNPEEAADYLANGAAFGMLGSLGSRNFNYGLRAKGQDYFAKLGPEKYGATTDVNGAPIDLDALHGQGIAGMSSQQKKSIQAMRGFLPGAQIYALKGEDFANVADQAGLPNTGGVYDAPQITTDLTINGKPQKVILLNSDLASLNHEAGHFIFDSLSPEQQTGLIAKLGDVPDGKLQDAYKKYTLSFARGYNFGEALPKDAFTIDAQGNPVFKADLHPDEVAAIQKAMAYFDNNPTVLAKEYLAEQFNDLANSKSKTPETLAAQTGNKSLAQSVSDAFSNIQQTFGGQGRTTALGFQVDPALQDSLRGVLKDIGARRKAEGPLTLTKPPQTAPGAPLSPVPPVSTPAPAQSVPAAPKPLAPQPQVDPAVEEAYEKAGKAAIALGLSRARVQAGVKTAREDGLTDVQDITKRILNPAYQPPQIEAVQSGAKTEPLPLAQEPAPAPLPLAEPTQEERLIKPLLNPTPSTNIRVDEGTTPKASIDPFKRTGIPSKVPPLSAGATTYGPTGPKPEYHGLKPMTRRQVNPDGSVSIVKPEPDEETGFVPLSGRAINPLNPEEQALAEQAATDSGDPEKFGASLQQVQKAIANGHEMNLTYNSSREEVEGSPTNADRKEAHAASELNLIPRELVQKTATPTGITVRQVKEPVFTPESASNAKQRVTTDYPNTRKRTLRSNFSSAEEAHNAIDAVLKAYEDKVPVQGLIAKQIKAVQGLLDQAPKTRFYADVYSQDKVIANTENLVNALADSDLLSDPVLKNAYIYLKSGEWAQDIKDRNENMAHGYRGDGQAFLNSEGVDQSALRREAQNAPPPVIIPDEKIQVLNALEGGTSRTFAPEGNVNAESAGRPTVDLKTKTSTNPFQAKLDALGEKLFLQRGDKRISGVSDIIAPASETLRLDRIETADDQAPVELPPSAYSQRAAGFMPHAEDAKVNDLNEGFYSTLQRVISAKMPNKANEQQIKGLISGAAEAEPKANRLANLPLAGYNSRDEKLSSPGNAAPLGLAGKSDLSQAGDASSLGGKPLATAGGANDGTATVRPLSAIGNRGSDQEQPLSESRASTPEQWLQSYLGSLAKNTGQAKYDGGIQAVYRHAQETGTFITSRRIDDLAPYAIEGGEEHQVYVPPKNKDGTQSIIKVTRPGEEIGHGNDEVSYAMYLENLNKLTNGELQAEIVGITSPLAFRVQGQNWPAFVSRMKFIRGVEPSAEVLENLLTTRYGFTRTGFNEYTHNDTGVVLKDANNENFILTPDGGLVPIDVHVEGDVTKPMFMLEAAVK